MKKNEQLVAVFKDKVIQTDDSNLFLKVIKPGDVTDEYVNWLNDYEIVKFTNQKYGEQTRKRVEQFVQEQLLSMNVLLYGIFWSNKHIGNIKLGPIDFNNKVAEISYFIGNKNLWGLGITTKTIKTIVLIAFEELDLEKATAGCYSLNTGSQKVLKNNGFIIEGTRKKQSIFEGERVDSLIFGLMRND